jgi:bifunctional DNA-binding transcriptional regulator/antitoxin component of YhaV-PrlF toxin-antitoxin module
MRTTIDKAGRLVIPKSLREEAGCSGEVEVVLDGTGIRIDAVATGRLSEEDGRPVIASAGTPIDDDAVRALRDAGRR